MSVRVAALTSGKNDPSARFRVRQFIEPLHLHGIEVREHIPAIDKHAGVPTQISNLPGALKKAADPGWRFAKIISRLPGVAGSWQADITWLNRELVFGRYTLERFVRKPYVFDVDDAIWQAKPDGEKAVARIARNAAIVFAGNQYIANYFDPYCERIEIVPTAIDTTKFCMKGEGEYGYENEKFVLGWTGSAGNYPYLYAIEGALSAFLASHNAELLVLAERPPSFTRIPQNKVRFVRWSPLIEGAVLREMSVGLMPLPDTDWARGKCGFKMLQYMASGLPVVVSPVGVNKEILDFDEVGYGATSDDEWMAALSLLYKQPDQAHKMGKNGRRQVEKKYSQDVVAKQISEIFLSIQKDRLNLP